MNKCGHESINNTQELQTFKNGVKHLRVSCGECNKFISYKQQPITDNYIIKFGKYKNCKINEIPRSYLDWLVNEDWIKENLKFGIKDYILSKI